MQNNRAIAVIEGIRDRLRVLLVSGEPHPGERTWRNLLKADASVDLVHFTILRPPEKQDGTPIKELSLIAFPTRELFVEKLDEFDLIIFDRYQRQGILPMAYLANVADYVAQGRRGADRRRPRLRRRPDGLYNTPLNAVLRRHSDRRDHSKAPFRPHVTDVGKRHPVTRGLARRRQRRRADAGAAGSASSMRQPEARRNRDVGARRQAAARAVARGRRPRRASSSPITAGCGRAAMKAADRRPNCCAASPTG